MGNFQFNSKFNLAEMKIKLIKSGLAVALAVSSMGALASCGKASTLKETMFSEAIVASVDGSKEIIKVILPECCYDSNGNAVENSNHRHYYNIITGEFLTDGDDCYSVDYMVEDSKKQFPTRYVENVDNCEDITHYLTEEEIQKLCNENLDTAELSKIVARINNQSFENTVENESSKSM